MSSDQVITAATAIAGVIGWPVGHSLSPAIHNAAFAEVGVDGIYVGLPVPPGQAGDAVASMRLFGWLGLSVTMPHKFDVMSAVDRVTDTAGQLASVNCVFREGDELVGDSTDGAGFVNGLRAELGVEVAGRSVAVVGAGGAARAVVHAVGAAEASDVIVVNRTLQRAEIAAALAPATGRVGTVEDLRSVDIVVNATPMGMADTDQAAALPFDVSIVQDEAVVCDLIYHPSATPLLVAAQARGLRTQNGVSMLVHQAAVAFELWTGVAAPVETMTAAAARAIGSRS